MHWFFSAFLLGEALQKTGFHECEYWKAVALSKIKVSIIILLIVNKSNQKGAKTKNRLKWYKILFIKSKNKINTKEIQKNKTIIDNLTKYIEFIVIKNGILLITDVQSLKNVNVAYIPTKKFSSSEKKKLVKLFYDNGLKRI